jgi:hypothetical protein
VTIGEFIPDAKPDRAEIPAAPDVNALVSCCSKDRLLMCSLKTKARNHQGLKT